MGLVIPWSITLIVVDAYSVFIKCLPRQPKILLVIIVGDLVRAVFNYELYDIILFTA